MSTVKTLIHAPEPPLQIEREFVGGKEIIVIEGVNYEADYFRTFSHPETDVLYQVQRVDDFVRLTVIETREQADEFFNEVEANA